MAELLALYRGRTVAEMELIGATMDPEMLRALKEKLFYGETDEHPEPESGNGPTVIPGGRDD